MQNPRLTPQRSGSQRIAADRSGSPVQAAGGEEFDDDDIPFDVDPESDLERRP